MSKTTMRAVALLATLHALSDVALAQSSFSEGAAAEALFREGAKRFDEGELAQACEKFAASQELEPAPGTALRLADCYDRIGKTASAWAAFQQAAALARASAQPEREEIATERAEDLYARLTYLKIEVAERTRALSGVEILLNDVAIPKGTWGTPIPVDPGPQTLVARAPGHEPWATELSVAAEPGGQSVEVPVLSRLERREAAPSVERGDERSAPPPVAAEPVEPSKTQRILAYVAGGLGLAGLGAGGYFTYRAYQLNEQSLDECLVNDANACTSRGKSLRDDARRQGTFATIAASSGFVLVGASVVLLLTEPDERRVADHEVRLVAGASPAGPSLSLGGTW